MLYVQESLDAEPEVFFDPNTLSSDGTIALNTRAFSEDGTLFAYALSESGSDWSHIQVSKRTACESLILPSNGYTYFGYTNFEWVKISYTKSVVKRSFSSQIMSCSK